MWHVTLGKGGGSARKSYIFVCNTLQSFIFLFCTFPLCYLWVSIDNMKTMTRIGLWWVECNIFFIVSIFSDDENERPVEVLDWLEDQCKFDWGKDLYKFCTDLSQLNAVLYLDCFSFVVNTYIVLTFSVFCISIYCCQYIPDWIGGSVTIGQRSNNQ